METISNFLESLFQRDNETTERIFRNFRRLVNHPDPKWSVIRPSVLGIHPELILDEGNDSLVCSSSAEENPEYVLKIYETLGIGDLRFYQDLTERANWALSGVPQNPSVEINPVLGFVYWVSRRRWVGVSKYISGYNLKQIFGTSLGGVPEMQETRKVMADAGLDEKVTAEQFARLDEMLNINLGVEGIFLQSINVKAVFDGPVSLAGLKFVVTDLAGSVSKIRKK